MSGHNFSENEESTLLGAFFFVNLVINSSQNLYIIFDS
jgi:hypothetical protein